MELEGRIAVVTGSSSGIGEATAKLLARRGARVLLVARSEAKLNELVQAIEAAGGKATAFAADLADASALQGVAEEIRDRFGTPDILINNAGVGRWLPLVETSLEEARQMIEVPYLAAVGMTREFAVDMIERGDGVIVNVTSPGSFMVWPKACTYIAARFALRGFTEALRTELRGSGVFVSLVVLGKVASSYWNHNPGSEQNVPRPIPVLMPTLTTDQAAESIVKAIQSRRKTIVRPWFFRCLFLLNDVFPGITQWTLRMMNRCD